MSRGSMTGSRKISAGLLTMLALEKSRRWEPGYRFKTISGLPFSYKIKTGRNGEPTKELWIDRRESSKSLTWSSVLLAFEKTEEKPLVERPKALGDIRGVSYIYGIFHRFGLIEVP